MTRIRLIPLHTAPPELRQAYDKVAELWQCALKPPMVVQIMQCFAHRPEFIEDVARGYYYVGWGGRLPRTVREFVAALVSRENACFYCVTAHAALLQAAGMGAGYVQQIVEREIRWEALAPGERAITTLVHKSVAAPAHLEPADLQEIVALFGISGSLEIVAVLAAFHCLNRMADLVGISSDLPMIQPQWRWLRWFGIRFAGWLLKYVVDLRNQEVEADTEAVLVETEAVLGPLPAGYQALHHVPNVAGFLLSIARVVRQLNPQMLARVTQGVAHALPSAEAEATGFHPLPSDPFNALVFVGTRYAVRTTDAMVAALRATYGYGDPELTDLFYAIAMCNGLERMHRLLTAVPSGA